MVIENFGRRTYEDGTQDHFQRQTGLSLGDHVRRVGVHRRACGRRICRRTGCVCDRGGRVCRDVRGCDALCRAGRRAFQQECGDVHALGGAGVLSARAGVRRGYRRLGVKGVACARCHCDRGVRRGARRDVAQMPDPRLFPTACAGHGDGDRADRRRGVHDRGGCRGGDIRLSWACARSRCGDAGHRGDERHLGEKSADGRVRRHRGRAA